MSCVITEDVLGKVLPSLELSFPVCKEMGSGRGNLKASCLQGLTFAIAEQMRWELDALTSVCSQTNSSSLLLSLHFPSLTCLFFPFSGIFALLWTFSLLFLSCMLSAGHL